MVIKNIKLYPSIKRIENNNFRFSSINENFWKQDFYLEEKIDGSNISFIKYKNQIYSFSRNQLITPQSFPTFEQFWTKWGQFIEQNLKEGEVLNAEFIQQGKIKYVFDENTIPNLVLFDCGKINPQWLEHIFNDGSKPDENIEKINFYDLDQLKQKFFNTPFKFSTITKIKVEPIISVNEKGFNVLSDLKVMIDGKELLFSTQLEKYLEENYFKNNSLIFPETNAFEGVVLKSLDGKFRLKNVFQNWKQFKKTSNKTSQTNIDSTLVEFIKTELEQRWEKFSNFLYWDDNLENPFKGLEDIYLKVKNDPSLIPKILSFKKWLYKDIVSELSENEKIFNKKYFKDNQQIILKTISTLLIKYIKNYQPPQIISNPNLSKKR